MQKLLRTADNPSLAVTWGIGRLAVMSPIAEAIKYVFDDFDVRLTIKRLPKEVRRKASREQLWAYLEEAVSPTCVAVLALAANTPIGQWRRG